VCVLGAQGPTYLPALSANCVQTKLCCTSRGSGRTGSKIMFSISFVLSSFSFLCLDWWQTKLSGTDKEIRHSQAAILFIEKW
jgi:hypothetical protein